MKFVIIYIHHPNLKEAKKVAEALLRDKLIACVNYFRLSPTFPINFLLLPFKRTRFLAAVRLCYFI